ncbi:Mediator of RNA polymerase II transcription subunit 14 [Neolecta irregularis DAH-3]|uniref:Mediator of RNA polymerase II transcription subunit 14 n=1 Tax=Neolecta irregularis (strain DAH-3) TaxID=1198029 RepID=A0A1U7LLD2_NEOID|nr:Mediator of RNA polymerase II transcription subunit 14 [Neolecta irregularis DAH-3]|eukprot:OLL23352.1 Mediator of RNA polymerase II transcription subunit 14 [Neolecta irregularis DAH-3]
MAWKLHNLRQQALAARSTLALTIGADSSTLALHYWPYVSPASALTQSQTCDKGRPNAIEIFISQTPEPNPIHDLLAQDHNLLMEYDRSILDIRWTRCGEIQPLDVDPSTTSVPALVQHITTLHSQYMLAEIASSLSDSSLVITRHPQCLNIQLTLATSLDICISPLRGNVTLRGNHPSLHGAQQSLNAQQMSTREIVLRLRSLVQAEEHNSRLAIYGLDPFRLLKHSLLGEFAIYVPLAPDWYLVCLASERFMLIEMKPCEAENVFYELVSQELVPESFSMADYPDIDKLVRFAKARTSWILLTRQLSDRAISFTSVGHLFGLANIPPLIIPASELLLGQWSMPNIFVRVVLHTAEIIWDLKIVQGNLDTCKMLPNSDSADVKFNPKTGQICILSNAIDPFLSKIRRIDEIITQVQSVPQGLELLGFSLEGVRWGYGKYWVDVHHTLVFGNEGNPHWRIKGFLEGRGMSYLAKILKATLGLLAVFDQIEKESPIETFILVRSAEEYRLVYPTKQISLLIQYKIKDRQGWWYISQDSGIHEDLSRIWNRKVVISPGCIVGKGVACRVDDVQVTLQTLRRTIEES